MIGILNKIWTPSAMSRRRRALDKARRQITRCGYKLDGLSDSQLEKALTRGKGDVEDLMPLTGKRINWTLRRISQENSQIRK